LIEVTLPIPIYFSTLYLANYFDHFYIMPAINIHLKMEYTSINNELRRLHALARTIYLDPEEASFDRPETYFPNVGLYKEEIMGQNSH
jgi:hypothetical protein